MAAPRDARCPVCGVRFACGVNTDGCWCRELVLDDDALRRIASVEDDCVCPDCLLRAKRRAPHEAPAQ